MNKSRCNPKQLSSLIPCRRATLQTVVLLPRRKSLPMHCPETQLPRIQGLLKAPRIPPLRASSANALSLGARDYQNSWASILRRYYGYVLNFAYSLEPSLDGRSRPWPFLPPKTARPRRAQGAIKICRNPIRTLPTSSSMWRLLSLRSRSSSSSSAASFAPVPNATFSSIRANCLLVHYDVDIRAPTPPFRCRSHHGADLLCQRTRPHWQRAASAPGT